ncbi:MAG: glycosyltransferase family 1 protein [Gammaproteobacteria bacterium]|nr:MAG: glycosyltransferase family 1 protein [Gammaproteobacteria bacterium]
MRVLLVHNRYLTPGGEDTVFESEANLLRRYGHEVLELVGENSDLLSRPAWGAALGAVWSRDAYDKIRELIRRHRPHIAHFHNTFAALSPSVLYACKRMGVPVVVSLHNQRIFCAKGTIYRDGRVCDKCARTFTPWPAILHKCYRGSTQLTCGVALLIFAHKALRTWQRKVDRYIVFTEFFLEKFVDWGLPPTKMVVKPHFVSADPGYRGGGVGEFALFVGRLTEEKGVKTLMEAWRRIEGVPLRVRGDGELMNDVIALTQEDCSVTWVPRLAKEELISLLKAARFLVWPSEGWYENFGMVAVEAFACGVPVIASDTGAMREIVADGRTGIFFEPGNPQDLAEKVTWAWENPGRMAEMGREARREYERKYSPERNYELLMEIYRQAAGR